MKKTLIGIGIATVSIAGVLILISMPPLPRSFDANVWRTCEHRKERFAMHEDLLDKHKLAGMTREKLLQLLGSSDGDDRADLVEWDMGQVGGSDDNYLQVRLKDNKVESYKVYQR